MKKISCYILDDLPSQFKVLEILIQGSECLVLEGKSSDPVQFIEQFNSGLVAPQLLFLDIDMPGMSGIEIAELLKGKIEIIFTTAHRDFAPEAFELNAIDYLLKPIRRDRFIQAVGKTCDKLLRQEEKGIQGVLTIPGHSKGSYYNLKLAEIVYIKSDSNYMTLLASGKRYIFISSLDKLEQQLPSQHFVRIHRSYIVNKNHIQAIKGNAVSLGSETIWIGRTYRNYVLPILTGNS